MRERYELSRRKVLASLGVVGTGAALSGLGTTAFFSDEERFANNRLVAGDLDMKVGWEEHYVDWIGDEADVDGVRMVESAGDVGENEVALPSADDPVLAVPATDTDGDGTTQIDEFMEATATDRFPDKHDRRLLDQLPPGEDPCTAFADVPDMLDQGGENRPLIDLADVKPGDFGEITFDFVLCSNPGLVWLNGGLVSASENGQTEPEADDPQEKDGVVELLDELQVTVWYDSGNNILEETETYVTDRSVVNGNPLSSAVALTGDERIVAQGSLRSVLDQLGSDDGIPLDGLPQDDTRHCFTPTPTIHRLGFLWELPVDHANEIQTDSVEFDLGFYTEQCRHNEGAAPGSGPVETEDSLTLLHDTHFHGNFENLFVPSLNIANYFGLMNSLAAERDDVLKVGNGDDLASSVLSSFFDGEHMTDALNAGGLDYNTFGNHDFDMGPDIARDRVADSEFTWLSANLLDDRTGDVLAKEQGARRYLLDDRGDYTLGITGVINEEAPEITSLGPNAVVQDVRASLREVVPQMRAEGADVVVVLSHLSSPIMEEVLADLTDVDIDAVVGDHAAFVFQQPKVINGTIFSAVGDQFEFVGELTLGIEDGDVVTHSFTLHDLGAAVSGGLQPDPDVLSVKEDYEQQLDQLDEVIGQSEVPFDTRRDVVRSEEANSGNYIADKMREFNNSDVGLMNGGGIRTDTLYFPGASASSPADVSKLLVFNVLPFGNTVVELEVSGADIRAALENGVSQVQASAGRFPQVSGLSFTWDPSASSGNRIVDVSVGGAPLDDSATYTLATNNFVAGGGDGYSMFTSAPRIVDENGGPLLAQWIVDSIEAESPIAPTVEGRITESGGSGGSPSISVPAGQF